MEEVRGRRTGRLDINRVSWSSKEGKLALHPGPERKRSREAYHCQVRGDSRLFAGSAPREDARPQSAVSA